MAGKIALTDIRLMVDYSDKDEAFKIGAKWDKGTKVWFAPKGADLNDFTKFMGDKTVVLKDTKLYVNFNDKEEVKSHGAWWDGDKQQWYIKAGSDIKDMPEKFFKENNIQINTDKISFHEFARIKGLLIDELIADGEIHRVSVEGGKAGARDGAYIYHDDANGKAGWLQNFKTGENISYGEGGSNSGKIKQTIVKDIEERKAERTKGYDDVAKKAQFLVSDVFKRAVDHPYLSKKGVESHNAKIDDKGALIIPLYNIEGKIRTFQRIDEEGNKIYIKGGEKSGNFFQFAGVKDKVIICEGFATGASIYEATKIPTISAMDSGNLDKVATSVREKYGNNCHITIAGDNDHKSEKNVGVETATKVAEKVGATVIIPQFTEEQMKQGYTDFNDYAKANGKLKLKEAIEKGDDKLIKHQKQKEIER